MIVLDMWSVMVTITYLGLFPGGRLFQFLLELVC
jgi:hypothetical protein